MSNPAKYVVATVRIDELRQNMTILAYTGFSNQYKQIDQKTCSFLRYNFSGAKAIVLRGEKKQEILAAEITVGDTILQLFSFPPSKQKLTRADSKLVGALKKKGILAFKVKKVDLEEGGFSDNLQDAIEQVNRMMKTPSRKQERLERGLFEANLLVEKVKESQAKRVEGSNIIEHMMNNARAGRLNAADIEIYVENVIRNSSAAAMSAIMNLRASDQTYSHCIDVGVLFQHIYTKCVEEKKQISAFQTNNQVLLGAFLHDFGKSQLPKEILESPARFDSNSKEMEMMRFHPHYGANLLKGMDMPDTIINMCLYHHVKMDGSLNTSYPKQASYSETTFEVRLLALADIYQALVGRRTYKRSWTPPQAMRYLSALAGIEYGAEIWVLFLHLMGEYPVGSLVVLNDDSIGFVMSVPKDDEDLFRPQVALVKNAHGQDLEQHRLLDLQEEKDMFIKNDMDVNEIFSKQALRQFSELRVVA